MEAFFHPRLGTACLCVMERAICVGREARSVAVNCRCGMSMKGGSGLQ
ncbi:hypothetical protein SODG_002941 [Sodalis praecaptivus]